MQFLRIPRPRFSLRTLGIGLTLVCIGLGLAVTYFHRARRQAAEIAALKKLGVVVWYDFNTEIEPDGSVRVPHVFAKPYLEPKEMFHQVTFLRAFERLDQDDLDFVWRCVGHFPRLKELRIGSRDADHSVGLVNLRRTKELRSLSIEFGKAENADWSPLGDLRELRSLDLSVNVDDRALACLNGLQHLQYLSIRGPAITDEGLKVVSELKNLEVLDLYDVAVTDSALQGIANLRKLRTLNLWSGSFGNQGLKAVARLPELSKLMARNCNVTDDGVPALAALNNLTDLNLRETQITDRGLKHLQALQRLQYLFLNGTQITDQGVAHLVALPSLKLIDCGETSVTAGGAAEVKKVLPNCSVWYDSPSTATDDR